MTDIQFTANGDLPPLIYAEGIESDEVVAKMAKTYLDNMLELLNEALRRGLNVEVSLDVESTHHAGGKRTRRYIINKFVIAKDLLK